MQKLNVFAFQKLVALIWGFQLLADYYPLAIVERMGWAQWVNASAAKDDDDDDNNKIEKKNVQIN